MSPIAVRQGGVADAGIYLDLRRSLDAETALMLLEPGERDESLSSLRHSLAAALRQGLLLLAERDGRAVGFLFARRGDYRRNRHVVDLGAGVLQAFWGQGIARRLFAVCEAWALAAGVQRLELGVMAHNARAIALYRQLGFEEEGRKRAALRLGDVHADELLMAKWLAGEWPAVRATGEP